MCHCNVWRIMNQLFERRNRIRLLSSHKQQPRFKQPGLGIIRLLIQKIRSESLRFVPFLLININFNQTGTRSIICGVFAQHAAQFGASILDAS